METTIDFEKYGFVEESTSGFYNRKDFPFQVYVENGFLCLAYYGDDPDTFNFTISEGKIPATNQSIVLLLKAFALPKL